MTDPSQINNSLNQQLPTNNRGGDHSGGIAGGVDDGRGGVSRLDRLQIRRDWKIRKHSMKRTLFALAATLAMTSVVSAQQIEGAPTQQPVSGMIVPVYPLPYPYTPLTPGQHNISPTSATGLTIPANATYAIVQAAGATVKYTTDGTTTPTSTIGMTLAAGSTVTLSGATVLANFKAISATGTLDVEFYR